MNDQKKEEKQRQQALGRVRALLKRRDRFNLGKELGKKRAWPNIIAAAMLDGSLKVPLKDQRVLYGKLAELSDRMSSKALFEAGAKSKDRSIRTACARALGKDGPSAGREREWAPGASGSRALWAEIIAILRPAYPRVVPFEELGAAVDQTADGVRAEVAAMVVEWLGTKTNRKEPLESGAVRPYLHSEGARFGTVHSAFHAMLVPDPYALEDLVAARRYEEVEARISKTGMKAIAFKRALPRLAWADGKKLSDGAQAWLSRSLFAGQYYGHTRAEGDKDAKRPVRTAADLVVPALDPESLRRFIVSAAKQKQPSGAKIRIPVGAEHVVDTLGLLRAHGKMRRRLDSIEGVATDAFFRWQARLGKRVNAGRLELAFPHAADLTGSAELWQHLIAQTLERALVQRMQIEAAHFQRCYVDNALAREAIDGVVLKVGDSFLRVRSDEDLALGDIPVIVAHPADGTADWPDGEDGRIPQRERPLFDVGDLPDWPPEAIPHQKYLDRVSALHLWSAPETMGGTIEASLLSVPGGFEWKLHHRGYGGGHGGRVPIEPHWVQVKGEKQPTALLSKDSREGWEGLPPAVRSESIYLLRRLLGLEALPAVAPDEPLPPLPPGAGKKRKTGPLRATAKSANADASDSAKDIAKGTRVRIESGENAGSEGVVFWLGKSKYGEGMRVGLKTDGGDTLWSDLDSIVST